VDHNAQHALNPGRVLGGMPLQPETGQVGDSHEDRCLYEQNYRRNNITLTLRVQVEGDWRWGLFMLFWLLMIPVRGCNWSQR